MVKTETRELAMHPKLLMDTIKRQAGSLQKVNLEGVMNAIEAGSPVVRIELEVDSERKAKLSIGDDGIGIETKEELISHFETFGTPHEANENTYWKQFRMGRGQMFAFGRNVWRTATFQMIVDIDNKGLTYELHENLPYFKGCQIDIDLYKNPIGSSHTSINEYKECIQEQVRFMEGQILFNGEQINTPASGCEWDFEDDNAYYMFNLGTGFKVYNLGAYVMNESMYKVGMAGIVVSKKQVKVNFARNDIQHDCEVYNAIQEIVKKNRVKKTRKSKKHLQPWERISTLKDLRDGTQDFVFIQSLALVPTVQGKFVSLKSVQKLKQPWCFAPDGDRYADRLMEREQALCINEEVLSDLGYTGLEKDFFTWLTNGAGCKTYGQDDWENLSLLYKRFDEFSEGISHNYQIIPNKKYTVTERRIISVIQNFDCWDGRNILLGYSDMAKGWTDGQSYICINRDWLRNKYMTMDSHIGQLIMLLTHELAHNDDSQETHVHGPYFYERMVDILNSSNAPITYCANFRDKMKRSRIEEKRAKEIEKQRKIDEKVNNKLGIMAKSA